MHGSPEPTAITGRDGLAGPNPAALANQNKQTMNLETIIIASSACFTILCLYLARRDDDTAAGVKIGNQDEDLRVVRICDSCRCYHGPDRLIRGGQHLPIMHDICPRCVRKSKPTDTSRFQRRTVV